MTTNTPTPPADLPITRVMNRRAMLELDKPQLRRIALARGVTVTGMETQEVLIERIEAAAMRGGDDDT